uniref:C-type lectin domain-containing protein n=1 Tax=Anopheles minimus TaxID=112268 RepID=A0A182WHS0_9DIPT
MVSMRPMRFKEYKAYKRQGIQFFHAYQLCRLYGGHLASIESADENARTESAIRAAGGDFTGEWYIGGIGTNDKFIWIGLNKKATYLNFYAGEPNNLPKTVEHCLVMGIGGQSKWNDMNCDYTQAVGFVCAFVRQ